MMAPSECHSRAQRGTMKLHVGADGRIRHHVARHARACRSRRSRGSSSGRPAGRPATSEPIRLAPPARSKQMKGILPAPVVKMSHCPVGSKAAMSGRPAASARAARVQEGCRAMAGSRSPSRRRRSCRRPGIRGASRGRGWLHRTATARRGRVARGGFLRMIIAVAPGPRSLQRDCGAAEHRLARRLSRVDGAASGWRLGITSRESRC